MGDALLSRTGIRISFDEPTVEESIEYLTELLSHPNYRLPDLSTSNNLYPFSLEVVTYVLENIGRRSIRKINEAFSIILELARLEGNHEITIDFVNEKKNEIMAWEN